MRTKHPVVAAPSPSPAKPRTITSSRERKLEAMLVLASELGFFCRPGELYLQDLATRLAQHLKNRVGKMVYQTVAFSMENFPLVSSSPVRSSRWPPCSRRPQ